MVGCLTYIHNGVQLQAIEHPSVLIRTLGTLVFHIGEYTGTEPDLGNFYCFRASHRTARDHWSVFIEGEHT